jgi:formylmethanofuran dehydrogenase subunit A
MLLLLANSDMLLDALSRGERALARDLAAVMLARTGAFGIKAVNPGGVASWVRGHPVHGGDPASVKTIDDRPAGLPDGVTPRAILETLADAAAGLPHALHVHCNRLGLPGNVETTLATLDALQGRRHHLTHLQFHAYAADEKGVSGGFASGAARLMERVNARPETTVDVGQVMFGPAVTMTEDSAVEYLLWQLTGRRWASVDVETEAGCGMVPFEYKDSNALHALQWAVGMEIFLLASDPWRVALSTDHPNGGSFLTYPKLIAQLMSRDVRAEQMKKMPPAALERTGLRDLSREYTLGEVAVITRAGPARILGLRHKGRLGVGADADVTIYDDRPDREAMFSSPKWVIKGGRVVVEDGHLRDPADGVTYRPSLSPDPSADRRFTDWWSRHGSYHPSQLALSPALAGRVRTVESA